MRKPKSDKHYCAAGVRPCCPCLQAVMEDALNTEKSLIDTRAALVYALDHQGRILVKHSKAVKKAIEFGERK